MADTPRVFTVLLNHRHADDTLRCLQTVRRSTYRNQFVVVVDNGSSSATVRELEEGLPTTTLLRSDENLGYAGGNNLAIRYALERDADFVWILNPDTAVEADALERMLASAALHPEAGLIGPRVLYGGSRPLSISSDGGLIDWEQGGSTTNLHDGDPVEGHADEGSHAVDYVTGSSLLVRRQVFEDVGLLPEAYFLYFEEADFAVAAREAGWDARVEVGARVHHYKRSFSALPAPYYVYYYIRGRLLFARRHAQLDLDAVERSLDHFTFTWRDRVARNAPHWVDTYDWLVSQALADGRAGRTGPRHEVHELADPTPAD